MKNSLQKDTIINNKKYPKGMKISRIFRQIMDDMDFKTIDMLYSNLLQTLFARGNLCLSIDPIDFLTMGDNACHWSSCHSLGGEFRGGLLSLLVDNCTIVCYLESSNKFIYNGIHLNNKKWRQLVHINTEDKIAVFNTQYPFEHRLIFNELVTIIKNLFQEESYLHQLCPNTTNAMKILDDYNPSPDEPLHFNDLLIRKINGSYENDIVNIIDTNKEFYLPNKKIIVGNTPKCPICGEKVVSIHKSMECSFCNPLEYCCTCAVPFHNEELHLIDSELYCDTCFDNEFTYCEKCDDIVRRNWINNNVHKCGEGVLLAM
jgi:hypothetical protein